MPTEHSIGERRLAAQVQPRRGPAIRSLAQPLRPPLLVLLLAALGCSERVSWVGFHGDALRSGWNPRESVLTPETVASDRFGKRWDSPSFDAFKGVPGRAYASPLYLEDVKLTGGPFEGRVADVVFVGTSNADVYAVSALPVRDIPAGTVLWKRHLGDPGHAIDGLRVGVLGTPVVDVDAQPPRLYVAADVQAPAAEGGAAWRVFALDLGNGNVFPGWPVLLDPSTVVPVNQNGPATFLDASKLSQRGGLAISPDGTLHVVYDLLRPSEVERTIQYRSKSPGAAWSGAQSFPSGRDGDIAVESDGRIHLAYGEDQNQPFLVYMTRMPGGPWSTPWVSEEAYPSGKSPRLALLASGFFLSWAPA